MSQNLYLIVSSDIKTSGKSGPFGYETYIYYNQFSSREATIYLSIIVKFLRITILIPVSSSQVGTWFSFTRNIYIYQKTLHNALRQFNN